MTKKRWTAVAAIAAALAVCAGALFVLWDGGWRKGPADEEVDNTFMIGWVSDPQWYSFKYFDRLTAQNDWIAEHFEELDMRYVVHTGDFVDLPHAIDQWESVHPEYVKWDEAGIPYGVLAGNHDVDGDDYTEFQQYFGAHRYEDNPWYGESYDNNRGHYDLMTMGGVDFIFVYLGYGDHSQEDLAWMNKVLSEHSDRIAMLAFHDYLVESGERSDAGNNIFNNVVLQNPNVRMVFCGHNYNATRRVDEIDDNGDGVADRTVYQMMANYQNLLNGGDSYFRMMTCDVEAGTIASVTYSPYLDEYNAYLNSESVRDEYGYQDEFTIPFDFSAPTPKAEGDPAVGTVVVNSRVSFAATDAKDALLVPTHYLNEAESGAAFHNAGIFDRTFSLTATDAFVDPTALNYVVVRYSATEGYHIDTVIKGETLTTGAVVAIPLDGAVIALAADAVDSLGNPVDVEAFEEGQVITFNQVYGRATPITTKFTTTITLPWQTTYGISGVNRVVGVDQWVILDATAGDSATAKGDDHQWNMLFAFAPTNNAGEYCITEVSTASGTVKDLAIPENGFVLAINTGSGKSSLRDAIKSRFTVGTTAAVEGYTPPNI